MGAKPQPLLDRLRDPRYSFHGTTTEEAADEIERLRTVLRLIANDKHSEWCDLVKLAQQALEK